MSEVTEMKWASALKNEKFFLIETFSGYRRSGRDPIGKQHTLPTTASARALGDALLDSLKHSRFLLLEEVDDFFDYQKNNDAYKLWVRDLMHSHGYKSKHALFKRMDCCNIDLNIQDRHIKIVPMTHEKLEGWGRTKGDGIEDVHLPVDSSPEEVGKALLLAFSRCR